MLNTLPDGVALLPTTEGQVPNTSSTLATGGHKVRTVLPLVGAFVVMSVLGMWMHENQHPSHFQKMSTAALTQAVEQKTYGYQNVGKGGCLLPNGTVPKNREAGIKENRAQTSCDQNPKCKGYVVSSGCRGAFLYENPDGTVTGGGKPPKTTYTWRNQPCMAKDLSMVYKKLGYGKCITNDDTEPVNEYLENVMDVECRQKCSDMSTCKGFSAATMNWKGCYLWKVGNLKAGGTAHKWRVASCYMKEEAAAVPQVSTLAPVTLPPVVTLAPLTLPATTSVPSWPPAPTGSDVSYTRLGSGKCTNAVKTGLKHEWTGVGSERVLQKQCSEDETCYGYSASRWGGGLLWKQGGLQKGGASWGGCSCMVKKT